MMEHPARDPDCPFKSGDIVRLEESYFILNEDLNPMNLATEAEIELAEISS
jgi:hypothetical protein